MNKAEWLFHTQPENVSWPNFTFEEMECSCGCGEAPELIFMDKLQLLRDRVGFSLPVTSGFRCETYDKSIGGAGVHPTGLAADIAISRAKAHIFIKWAMHYGMTGIGIKGRGDRRFVHVDMLSEDMKSHPRPTIWTYNG